MPHRPWGCDRPSPPFSAAVDSPPGAAYSSGMNKPDTFEVNLVSPALRALNAVIFAVVAAAQILALGETGLSVAGILIMAVSALGALFEERWTFDLSAETARFRFGLLFLAHARVIPFADISRIEFDDFEKGFNKQKWTRVVMRVPGGKDEIIDTVNRKKATALIAKAERLASFFESRNEGNTPTV